MKRLVLGTHIALKADRLQPLTVVTIVRLYQHI